MDTRQDTRQASRVETQDLNTRTDNNKEITMETINSEKCNSKNCLVNVGQIFKRAYSNLRAMSKHDYDELMSLREDIGDVMFNAIIYTKHNKYDYRSNESLRIIKRKCKAMRFLSK